jgi:preprotein translocase subunit SecG
MLLYYTIATLHVIVCFILVLVVLLQSGKGADLAGAFGGGATQTAFGSRGPASFLSKMTTVAAVLFMITSISLSMISRQTESGKSVLETTTQPAATEPAAEKPAAQPEQAVPTPEEIKRIQKEYEAKQEQEKETPATQSPAKKSNSGQTP